MVQTDYHLICALNQFIKPKSSTTCVPEDLTQEVTDISSPIHGGLLFGVLRITLDNWRNLLQYREFNIPKDLSNPTELIQKKRKKYLDELDD